MTKLGEKEGLFTRDEIKVLWKIASGKLPIPGILKPIVNLIVPSLLDGFDNKVGDRIPEPWQTHCENLVTIIIDAVEDEKVTQEEAEKITSYAAKVLDEQIDIPMLDDDTEAVVFEETLRLLAVLLYDAFKK